MLWEKISTIFKVILNKSQNSVIFKGFLGGRYAVYWKKTRTYGILQINSA